MRALASTAHASPLVSVGARPAPIQEMQMLIGEIDGVQLYGCDKCGATAFALKRHVEPKIDHKGDCGKVVLTEADVKELPSESRIPLNKLTPPDSSEQ